MHATKFSQLATIASLRNPGLEDAYANAWDEWETGGEQADWEHTSADGLRDEA